MTLDTYVVDTDDLTTELAPILSKVLEPAKFCFRRLFTTTDGEGRAQIPAHGEYQS